MTPPPRRLMALAVATLLLLVAGGVGYLLRHSMDGWTTSLGRVAPFDLLATALAMGIGGAIAKRGFVVPAVGLVLLLAVASAGATLLGAPALSRGVIAAFARETLLQALLAAGIAAVAALAGERLARRASRPATAA